MDLKKMTGLEIMQAFAQGLFPAPGIAKTLSLIHISEPTRPVCSSRMPSSA